MAQFITKKNIRELFIKVKPIKMDNLGRRGKICWILETAASISIQIYNLIYDHYFPSPPPYFPIDNLTGNNNLIYSTST